MVPAPVYVYLVLVGSTDDAAAVQRYSEFEHELAGVLGEPSRAVEVLVVGSDEQAREIKHAAAAHNATVAGSSGQPFKVLDLRWQSFAAVMTGTTGQP
jgi:hypothetical protein